MEYRTYGKTGKVLSILGCGGLRFENPLDIENSAQVVLKAFEQGINYFEAGPGYCADNSEKILGLAVREMKKTDKPFYLCTKSMQSDGKDVRRDLERSLKRLDVEAIDFYMCWYLLTMQDWEQRKAGGAVKELLKAKEEGLIRHVAFSSHQSGSEIRKVIEEGYFEGVTLGYSAINFPYRQEGLEAAGEHNMGVVAMNPLGGGVITSNNDTFSFLRARPEQTVLEAALHFLMADKRISVILVGFRNEVDVDTAVKAVENYSLYSSEQIQRIKEQVQDSFNSLCTTCMYCNICPEGIAVWKFLESYNHLLLKGGMPIMARLQNFWGVSINELEKCTQCEKCESVCTQHLPILKRFKHLRNIGSQIKGPISSGLSPVK